MNDTIPANALPFASALAGAEPFPSRATSRLVLREFEDDDAPAVWRIFSDEAMAPLHNIAPLRSLADAQRLLDQRISQWPRGYGVRWAIALRDRPNDAIGSCGFDFDRRHHGAVELSYDLDPAHWRRGFAREALRAAVDCAFDGSLGRPEIMRIEALTRPDNAASARLLGALGFRREGVLRQFRHWRGIDNQPVDLECWSLLRADPMPS